MKSINLGTRKEKLTSIIIIIFALLFSSFYMLFMPQTTKAVPGSHVFGGLIYSITDCDCSSGQVLYVGPPRAALVWLGDSAQTYMFLFGNPHVMSWVLGDRYNQYTVQCWVEDSYWCDPVYYQGEVVKIGSSW